MKIMKSNRNHSANLNTSTMSTLQTDRQTKSSFVNDDYEYLINCTDLITTCQEALQENAQQQPELLQMKPQSHLQPNPAQIIIANCQPIQANASQQQQQQTNLLINCDQSNDLSSIRAPSSAASSGLGLSLEEDLSLKYCQSDEEFSSLNSNATTNESLINTTNNGPCSFTAKALVAEFIEWLDYIENQLDSVCYCAKIAQDINGEVLDGSDDDEPLANEYINQSDKQKTKNANNNSSTVNCNDLNENLSTANIVLQRPNDNVDYDQNVVDEDEAEELMMSMPHINDNLDDVNDESFVINNEFVHNLPKSTSSTFNGGNNGDVDSSAAIYMLASSRKANLCLPENTMVNWSVIMARHESFQNEFEKITHQFFKNIRQITKPINGGISINGIGVESIPETSTFDLKSSSNDTASVSIGNSTLFRSIEQQKNRCLLLWLKSLEYLTILQHHSGKRCPRHFSNNKSNLLNGIKVDSADEIPTIVHHHHHHQHFLLSNSSGNNPSRTPSLIRSYSNILFGTKNTNSRLQRVYSTARKESSSGGKSNQSVELKSTGTGNSSVVIKNRRVQTSAQTSTGANNLNNSNRSRNVANMIEQGESIICDTHSLDGSGSPGADSGVFSSSMENSKYEIIQKDIGYSSDADMSDAIEAQPNSSDQSSSQRSAKKRQVRRRRTRTSRNRPWSFHADWTAWDYYQTPFICNDDHFSNEDLNYTNENIIRKLTEFGENYESWFANELDTDTDIRDIKSAVVIEKPEIEAFGEEPIPAAVEKSTVDACISTSPIPFMDKECQANYEPQAESNKNEIDQLKMEIKSISDSKSTQTKRKIVRDSACSPEPPRAAKSKFISAKLESGKVCNGCHCTKNTANASSYSSIKFYTTLALAGLFSFIVAVTQFSPEIHKTYPRPPPL